MTNNATACRDKSELLPEILAQIEGKEILWLWKNFVNGRPEYWAFDNPYPSAPNGDPITTGEPCGYAIFMPSINQNNDSLKNTVSGMLAGIRNQRAPGMEDVEKALSSSFLNQRIAFIISDCAEKEHLTDFTTADIIIVKIKEHILQAMGRG